MELFLNDKLGKITYQFEGAPTDPLATLIIAHGTGAGMDHPFMKDLSRNISQRGLNTVRFNFPYMEKGRKVPGSQKHALIAWQKIIEEIVTEYPRHPIFISGKSYGGRMASHLLIEEPETSAKGIIYFGSPLHAFGKGSKERADHLFELKISLQTST